LIGYYDYTKKSSLLQPILINNPMKNPRNQQEKKAKAKALVLSPLLFCRVQLLDESIHAKGLTTTPPLGKSCCIKALCINVFKVVGWAGVKIKRCQLDEPTTTGSLGARGAKYHNHAPQHDIA